MNHGVDSTNTNIGENNRNYLSREEENRSNNKLLPKIFRKTKNMFLLTKRKIGQILGDFIDRIDNFSTIPDDISQSSMVDDIPINTDSEINLFVDDVSSNVNHVNTRNNFFKRFLINFKELYLKRVVKVVRKNMRWVLAQGVLFAWNYAQNEWVRTCFVKIYNTAMFFTCVYHHVSFLILFFMFTSV